MTLNKGIEGAEVAVFLLDERYERDQIPCDTRRRYCEHLLQSGTGVSSGKSSNRIGDGSDGGAGGSSEHGSSYGSGDEVDGSHLAAWCEDFLYGETPPGAANGPTGPTGPVELAPGGSCCAQDEEIFFGWCLREDSRSSAYYREACDVTYELFGHRALVG